jgi:hypothetical protein
LPVRGSFAFQRVAEALIGRVRVDFTIPQIRAKKGIRLQSGWQQGSITITSVLKRDLVVQQATIFAA